MASLTPLQHTILAVLADGGFHSGEGIARHAGVSRAAVSKAVKALRGLAIDVRAVSGRGYSLARSLVLLDRDLICSYIPYPTSAQLEQFHVLQSVDSTNAWLMRLGGGSPVAACVAEHQGAGRGRRGRHWFSPFGSNLYLSLRWRFEEGMGALSGLSLAVAVAVLRSLRELDITDVGVKWPNDIYWHGRKLGGILLEVAGESAGPCQVVIGVGLNVNMPADAVRKIDQPWVDLVTILPAICRNRLAGLLLHHLVQAVHDFQRTGFASFEQEWEAADLLRGQIVVLQQPGEEICGIGRGIACDGALLLAVGDEVRRYTYGEVSVRLRDVPA